MFSTEKVYVIGEVKQAAPAQTPQRLPATQDGGSCNLNGVEGEGVLGEPAVDGVWGEEAACQVASQIVTKVKIVKKQLDVKHTT